MKKSAKDTHLTPVSMILEDHIKSIRDLLTGMGSALPHLAETDCPDWGDVGDARTVRDLLARAACAMGVIGATEYSDLTGEEI